jgi:hypothetical protein
VCWEALEASSAGCRLFEASGTVRANPMSLRPLLLSALLASTAACGLFKPTPPRITPRAAAVTSASSAGLGLRVDLVANNPNRIDVTVQSIDVRVSLAGRDLGVTHLTRATPLPSKQDVPLSVDVTAPWSDLPGIVLTTALNENVPYHLDGTAHVGAGRFTLDVPFAVDSTMPRSVLTGALSNSLPSLGH